MHRSGTSLVSQVLDDAGVFMGVMRDHNGESFPFLNQNEEWLAAQNLSWHQPEGFDPEKSILLSTEVYQALHYQLQSSAKWRLALFYNGKWGFKDPRSTFTLGAWLKVFPKAKVIHVVRNGVDVALSLSARNQRPEEVHEKRFDNPVEAFHLWQAYVKKALEWEKLLTGRLIRIEYEKICLPELDTVKSLSRLIGKKADGAIAKNIRASEKKKKDMPPALSEIAVNCPWMKALGYNIENRLKE